MAPDPVTKLKMEAVKRDLDDSCSPLSVRVVSATDTRGLVHVLLSWAYQPIYIDLVLPKTFMGLNKMHCGIEVALQPEGSGMAVFLSKARNGFYWWLIHTTARNSASG